MGRNPDIVHELEPRARAECALSHGPPPDLVRSRERPAARRHIHGFASQCDRSCCERMPRCPASVCMSTCGFPLRADSQSLLCSAAPLRSASDDRGPRCGGSLRRCSGLVIVGFTIS
jgi:hypothetical protein